MEEERRVGRRARKGRRKSRVGCDMSENQCKCRENERKQRNLKAMTNVFKQKEERRVTEIERREKRDCASYKVLVAAYSSLLCNRLQLIFYA